MKEEKPAFITPLCLHFGHFHRLRVSRTCRTYNLILAKGTTTRYYLEQSSVVSATASRPAVPAEPILEGDLIVYRDYSSQVWSLGAIIDTSNVDKYQVRSVYSRSPAEDGTVECFVDWDENSSELTITSETHEISFVDADYEERVVQDRLQNPHGEVSEDCWRISTHLLDSLGVVIREFHKS